ncbi:integrase arm-type DNA-binding domain-containing protein [uncultured Pseudoteredinibacter sp.]|uniref:tyrosine-type recombinase/integrase n=1 Tax=uncultured Pseudoteredinibacter sp. TaxID=1641701 RepID=UPI002625B782|nr:integrase arm-type DNA-binding domain-containing protein [uncultured Pseudoteredinibacter sp.]
MPLNNTGVKNAKPKDKPYKLTDQGGLYLMVRPTGTKTWKYDFRINNTRGSYTIGSYPETSLQEARAKHLEARKLVQEGQNPTGEKQAKRLKAQLNQKRFSHYADQWIKKQNLAKSTEKDLKQRISTNLTPYLDKKPIESFNTRELLDVLTPISDRGARETAIRLAGVLRRIFNELLILGLINNNPAQGLAELLPKPDHRSKKNFGHITDIEDLKNLMQQIYTPRPRQSPIVGYALKLMPLLFLRPKNIRFLRWEQIDFEDAMLTIPGDEMKAGKELKVPLATQAVALLKKAQELTGGKEYVFLTSHGHGKPMSENTTTAALKRLTNPKTGKAYGTGFMTSHGFRHTASTFLNEMGFSADAIELQLAHVSEDRVRSTYNKAQLMDERVKMMQNWADFVDQLIR